jgi:hypothetical protein
MHQHQLDRLISHWYLQADDTAGELQPMTGHSRAAGGTHGQVRTTAALAHGGPQSVALLGTSNGHYRRDTNR